MALQASVAFAIDGPSPVGRVFQPDSYSSWNMRNVLGVITGSVGILTYSFLTNLRVDESTKGRIWINPATVSSGATTFVFDADLPILTYQPDNLEGYNWLITTVIRFKTLTNAVVDFPAGGTDLTIDIEWETKGGD